MVTFPQPGRFLLTGSSRVLALRSLPDALPGRMEVHRALAVSPGGNERRAAFFSSYLSTLIERDALEVSSIERQGDLYRLLALLAGRGGS